MLRFIENLLGDNWRTSLWGGIMLIALAINQTPTIIDFLPDNAEGWVRGISGLIVVASGLKFVSAAKDKNNE
jgi:cytochrome c biogenesis protein CcdA